MLCVKLLNVFHISQIFQYGLENKENLSLGWKSFNNYFVHEGTFSLCSLFAYFYPYWDKILRTIFDYLESKVVWAVVKQTPFDYKSVILL